MSRKARFSTAMVLSGLLFLGPQNARALTCGEGPDAPARAAPGADRRAMEKLVAAGLPADEAASRVTAMATEEVAYLADTAPRVRSGGITVLTIFVVLTVVTLLAFLIARQAVAPDY